MSRFTVKFELDSIDKILTYICMQLRAGVWDQPSD